MWEIDTPLNTDGGELAYGNETIDWRCWLVSGPHRSGFIRTHMLVQFGSFAVSRAQADEIVGKILAGLNAPAKAEVAA